jgi:hypothetical protein
MNLYIDGTLQRLVWKPHSLLRHYWYSSEFASNPTASSQARNDAVVSFASPRVVAVRPCDTLAAAKSACSSGETLSN